MQSTLQKLECPNCSAPLSQHNPSAQTIICTTCGTHVAIGMGAPENLGQGRKAPPAPKPIKIGATATISGDSYIVLGRVVYRGWSQRDRDESWTWHEWLMGGDNGKMLWLSYDEKGFALYRKIRFRGAFDPTRDMRLDLGEKKVTIRERYPARIIGAEGELTWKASPGEQLFVAEGQTQNVRYSIQQTPQELEIHEGMPFTEKVIAEAFGDEAWANQAESAANNRGMLRSIGWIGILFAVAGFICAMLVSGSGDVLEPRFVDLTIRDTTTTIPIEFDQAGRPAIITMSLASASIPENTFVEVDMSVIAPDQQRYALFVQELWHETGTDSDGFWRETQYRTSEMFVPLQAGPHKLELIYDPANPVDGVRLGVEVTRNHIMPQWFIIYGILAMLVGILCLFLGYRNPHSA